MGSFILLLLLVVLVVFVLRRKKAQSVVKTEDNEDYGVYYAGDQFFLLYFKIHLHLISSVSGDKRVDESRVEFVDNNDYYA